MAYKPVSLFVCGVQKGGTTSLYSYLCEHAALSAPDRKEPHVFDDETIDWTAPDMSRLDSLFAPDDEGRIRFDCTPIYAYWPPAMERIQAYNPLAKLIFLLRDPLERAYSQWCMEFARGSETLPFALAIREGRERMAGLPPLAPQRRVYSYVERGAYLEQVGRALSHFPRDQLLFLRSEDLRDNHRSTLARIAEFIGLGSFPESGPKLENRRPLIQGQPEPTLADRELVAELVGEDLNEVMSLTGLDLTEWSTMQLASAPATAATPAAATRRRTPGDLRPNVLFIVADDLNSWIGALGSQPDVKTPAIDALARRGTLFSRAYCAAPYCNASRMSVFTGCLPTTTGVYANEPFWEAPLRRKTYIEAFRQAGYHTHGAGKVFHGAYDYASAGRERADMADWVTVENRLDLWDHFDTSAPEPMPRARPLNGMFDFDRFEDVPSPYHHFDWGPLPDDVEAQIPDELVCQSITDFFASPQREPFFCAAGLYKPHLPWYAPKRFFDLYDPERISLPTVRQDDLDDVPPIARQWALNPDDHQLVTSRGQWRAAVHGYLAAISYCDWIVGRIIDALDRSGLAESTTIVLWGDNGFHLGEKLHWRKFVLWEEAARVPLIVVPPKGIAVRPSYDDPVSLVDIFPTISDLCGVDGPEFVDGSSLLRAMTTEYWPGRPALTTWGRGNHSVRQGAWRYTHYEDGGEELYNHSSDPNEWNNLSSDSRYASQIQRLSAAIRRDR